MSPVIVIRDAGGLGDIIRLYGILSALADAGHQVTFHTDAVYKLLVELCPAVADGRVGVSLWDMTKHEKRGPLGPFIKRWGDRAPYMTGDHADDTRVIDFFCPALAHEVGTHGRPRMDRVECWARAAGIATPPPGSIGLAVPKDITAAARRWRAALGPGSLVAVSPASNASIRTWRNGLTARGRTGRIGTLLAMLRQRGIRTVAFDTEPTDLPADVTSIDHDVRIQAARIATCDAFIGPDSGFLHIACALKIPSVGIFGPTDGRLVLMPYTGRRTILQGAWTPALTKQWGCVRPCYGMPPGYNDDCGGRCAVLESVPERAVADAVANLLPKRTSLQIRRLDRA